MLPVSRARHLIGWRADDAHACATGKMTIKREEQTFHLQLSAVKTLAIARYPTQLLCIAVVTNVNAY